MQAAKDSFYVEWRNRLAALDPALTINVNAMVQPAIVVVENQSVTAQAMPPTCFCLRFGAVRAAKGWEDGAPALLAMECTVTYRTTTATDGSGRGRALAALDADLLGIWSPGVTAKLDYTQTPAQPLGTNVVWLRPALGAAKDENAVQWREAKLTLFFYPEVGA